MKYYSFLFMFMMILTFQKLSAPSDVLSIKLKNNQIEHIAISDLQKITFEMPASIEDVGTIKDNLSTKGNYVYSTSSLEHMINQKFDNLFSNNR